ncbi:MAG: A/G-specific adenine glycosylase [Alphaproteobacteria bacterium PRO2]|nr:A/G-specific adenine glycosylase [Alphaproteobacteria bacterium PRO2]
MSKAKLGKKFTQKSAEEFRERLLGWYDRHARILPWRYTKNQKPDPYRVWLSEIMLQQTTVAAVGPYFNKFTEKWPDIHALANANEQEVMRQWAGLGYYSRARNLHKCAVIVSGQMQGTFPTTQDELKKLPGIGDYTSAAIRAIAFNQPATVVDGNVERIMARIFAWPDPIPGAKKDLKNLAAGLFENYDERPGDLAQALMDLGATICIPKSPRCGACPVSQNCMAYKKGIAAELPLQEKKKARPRKFGHVYWITNGKGDVLVHRRPPKGLLGGMIGLPTSSWEEAGKRPALALKNLKTTDFGTSVRHVFTHFELELALKTSGYKGEIPDGYAWIEATDIENAGFPTVFKKAVRLFLKQNKA